MKRNWVIVIVSVATAGLLLCRSHSAFAGADDTSSATASMDLAELSLEELMNVEVYSVSKKKQKLSDSAAAIYVLTQDDIKRSGATNIPEALRLVPGVEVAHIDSNNWAITIRGFNERFANKLLVLIDGRSVYTPLFAGVYWDVQDLFLEDVDRIEVIRGPGGTLWGANAVNGVINIITKEAANTQGVAAQVLVGNKLDYEGAARYGGKIGDVGHYRIYGKWFQRDNFETAPEPATGLAGGLNGGDGWRQGRAGFRADWQTSEADFFTAEGDIYQGTSDSRAGSASLDPPYLPPVYPAVERTDVAGGNLLTRWRHEFSEDNTTELQVYYDRTNRKSGDFREDRDTVDFEFQHNINLWRRHQIVWGLGYRISGDSLLKDFRYSWTPKSRSTDLYSGFVQDEISFLDDKLKLTIGTKLEHNSYTDWEVQPNIRALWRPADRHTLWASISRAVRTPSRSEEDIRLNTAVVPPNAFGPGNPPLPTVVSLFGNHGFDSEDLIAYEFGYRSQLHDTLSIDLTAYYNDYDHLRTISPDGSPFLEGTHLVQPFLATNFMNGETYGVEVAVDWSPTDYTLVRAGYSYIDIDLSLNAGAAGDTLSLIADGASPHNQAFAHWFLDLPYDTSFDLVMKYVDRLETLNVDSYFQLDTRLAWEPIPGLELAFVGQNLTNGSNQEFTSSALVSSLATRVPRSFYGSVTWHY